MGAITETIERLVGEYIRDRGVVLWFDPSGTMEGSSAGGSTPDRKFAVFDGVSISCASKRSLSFGARPTKAARLSSGFLGRGAGAACRNAEFGVDLRREFRAIATPGCGDGARRAEGPRGRSATDDLDKQIEQGGLTLDELEELALGEGAMRVNRAGSSFGTTVIDEAALNFLATPERDADLAARNG